MDPCIIILALIAMLIKSLPRPEAFPADTAAELVGSPAPLAGQRLSRWRFFSSNGFLHKLEGPNYPTGIFGTSC